MVLGEVTVCCCLTDSHRREKQPSKAVEVKAFQGTLPFIVKITCNSEIKSKAGKEFTNEKEKKFGIGLTGSGLGNASGKSYRVGARPYVFPWRTVSAIGSVSSPTLNTT